MARGQLARRGDEENINARVVAAALTGLCRAAAAAVAVEVEVGDLVASRSHTRTEIYATHTHTRTNVHNIQTHTHTHNRT